MKNSIDMKRNYQKPVMTVVKIGLQKMIAASPTESFSNAQIVSEGTAGARGGSGWDDED